MVESTQRQQNGPGSLLASYSYTLDNVGNRTHLDETINGVAHSVDWTYDNAYRLLSETHTGSIVRQSAYTYDDTGNRLTEMLNNETTSYSYNLNDQLTHIDRPGSADAEMLTGGVIDVNGASYLRT